MDRKTLLPIQAAEEELEKQTSLSSVMSQSAAVRELKMTPKEELAVIVERLRQHEKDATDEGCKVRLELAADLVRFAIHRR
jgi:hypothetical protein